MAGMILAIDTSTPTGDIALWDDGRILFQRDFTSHRSHNSQLFAPLKEALALAESRLSLIVVGTGPGSYTGVRIGIAAAQGLAWSLGIPVLGLPSVLAPLALEDGGECFVCGDARRGQYHVTHVQGGVIQGEICTLTLAEFTSLHQEQSALPWYTFDPKVPGGLEAVQITRPSAIGLAEVAGRLAKGELESLASQALEPVYLSEPFVTTKFADAKGA